MGETATADGLSFPHVAMPHERYSLPGSHLYITLCACPQQAGAHGSCNLSMARAHGPKMVLHAPCRSWRHSAACSHSWCILPLPLDNMEYASATSLNAASALSLWAGGHRSGWHCKLFCRNACLICTRCNAALTTSTAKTVGLSSAYNDPLYKAYLFWRCASRDS